MPLSNPFPSHQDFGTASNLGQAQNSEVVFDNTLGFPTIGLRLTVPPTGTVTFEGSFDGTNYISVSMRNIGTNGYAQTATADGTYIGSISAMRKFRVRTSTAGSSAGTVMGRVTREVSTIEGIEHGNPPDKVGYTPVHKGVNITSATTTSVWTPATGKKFVVTDINLTLTGNVNGVLTIFDGTDSAGNWLHIGDYLAVAVGATGHHINIKFTMPFQSATADNVLKITTSAANTVRGVIHGYEI